MWGSKPHFLGCDPSVRDAVEGIREPDESVDDIFVDIEPVRNDVVIQLNILSSLYQITGSTLYAHQQLQINVNITQTSDFFP